MGPEVGRGRRGRRGVVLPPAPAGVLDSLGGRGGVERFVERFYARVRADPDLAPLFPHFQTSGLAGFLGDWLEGVPPLADPWAEGLEARHLRLHVPPTAAARWLGHLASTLDRTGLRQKQRDALLVAVGPVARALVNGEDAPFDSLDLEGACAGVSTSGMRAFEELRKAARAGRVDVVRAGLDADPASVRRRGEGGATLLWDAAGTGELEVVELLLDAGADPDAPAATTFECDLACRKGPRGTVVAITPYAHARDRRRRAVAERLLAAGAVVDAFDHAYLGDAERLAEALREAPGWVHAIDPGDAPREVTLLHHAVRGGSVACVRLLVEHGAEVRRHSTFLLTIAASRGDAELVALLLEAGADARAADLLGPLDGDEHPVAELLVRAGFDPDHTERFGAPLARVCRPDVSRNAVHRARVLLGLGASPDVLGNSGLAPLHYAVRGRDVELARLLLRHGADPERRDRAGRTPREHAKLSRSTRDPAEVLGVLEGARGKPGA